MKLTPGTKLGPYEIQCLQGAGGMGEVYRARDTRLLETLANLDSDFEALLKRKRATAQAVGESFAFEKFHDQKTGSVLRADVVELANVRMIQRENCAGLTLEALPGFRIGRKMLGQYLDRDGARKAIRQHQAHLFQVKTRASYRVAVRFGAPFLLRKNTPQSFLAEHIPFPKQPRRLPTVFSPEEVTQLIDSASNLFRRTLLMTLYSTGMRRAEVCRLQLNDLDRRRMMIRIQQGKGKRDREVPLSLKLLDTLRVYWRWMKPKTFSY
jgi:integrase